MVGGVVGFKLSFTAAPRCQALTQAGDSPVRPVLRGEVAAKQQSQLLWGPNFLGGPTCLGIWILEKPHDTGRGKNRQAAALKTKLIGHWSWLKARHLQQYSTILSAAHFKLSLGSAAVSDTMHASRFRRLFRAFKQCLNIRLLMRL